MQPEEVPSDRPKYGEPAKPAVAEKPERPKWGQPIKPAVEAEDRPKWGEGRSLSVLQQMSLEETASHMEGWFGACTSSW